jgi:hypothetical protein
LYENTIVLIILFVIVLLSIMNNNGMYFTVLSNTLQIIFQLKDILVKINYLYIIKVFIKYFIYILLLFKYITINICAFDINTEAEEANFEKITMRVYSSEEEFEEEPNIDIEEIVYAVLTGILLGELIFLLYEFNNMFDIFNTEVVIENNDVNQNVNRNLIKCHLFPTENPPHIMVGFEERARPGIFYTTQDRYGERQNYSQEEE